MTKYFVDAQGNYLGGFDGSEPPVGSVEVPAPPIDGRQKWQNGAWQASTEAEAEKAAEQAMQTEFDAAKLDPWMVQFRNMTPAQAQQFVLNNSANLSALTVHVGRLAYATRFLLGRVMR